MKQIQANINFPKYIKKEHEIYFQPHLKFTLYYPEIKKINNCIIFKDGSIINKNGIVDEALPWTNFNADTNWKYYFGKVVKSLLTFNFKLIKLKNIFFVINVFSNNYFHWITEVIPKLIYLKNSIDSFSVLLNFDNLTEYQKTTLELLDIKYILIKKNIIFISKIKIVPRLSEWSGYYSKKILSELKGTFIKRISLNNDTPKKVYISRKKAKKRKLLNEYEIIDVLKKNDFFIVCFEDLSFIEQIELIQNTEILISLHGAGLTNMIFMKNKGKIFEFLPENKYIDKCYFVLSETLEHEYHYQFCKINGKLHTESDYTIDAVEFKKNLDLLLNN